MVLAPFYTPGNLDGTCDLKGTLEAGDEGDKS
jgi:hypothetical protein